MALKALTKFRKKQQIHVEAEAKALALLPPEPPKPKDRWKSPTGTFTLKRGRVVKAEKPLLLIDEPAPIDEPRRDTLASDLRVVAPGMPQCVMPIPSWFSTRVMLGKSIC